MNTMKRTITMGVAALMLAATAAFSSPALADAGSPYNPGDGRVNAMTGDHVMVYLNSDSIYVWGLDGSGVGQWLTSFTQAELAKGGTVTHKTDDPSNGTVTLTLDTPSAVSGSDTSLVVLTPAQYHVTWTGGVWGADGSDPFVKTFSAYYGI